MDSISSLFSFSNQKRGEEEEDFSVRQPPNRVLVLSRRDRYIDDILLQHYESDPGRRSFQLCKRRLMLDPYYKCHASVADMTLNPKEKGDIYSSKIEYSKTDGVDYEEEGYRRSNMSRIDNDTLNTQEQQLIDNPSKDHHPFNEIIENTSQIEEKQTDFQRDSHNSNDDVHRKEEDKEGNGEDITRGNGKRASDGFLNRLRKAFRRRSSTALGKSTSSSGALTSTSSINSMKHASSVEISSPVQRVEKKRRSSSSAAFINPLRNSIRRSRTSSLDKVSTFNSDLESSTTSSNDLDYTILYSSDPTQQSITSSATFSSPSDPPKIRQGSRRRESPILFETSTNSSVKSGITDIEEVTNQQTPEYLIEHFGSDEKKAHTEFEKILKWRYENNIDNRLSMKPQHYDLIDQDIHTCFLGRAKDGESLVSLEWYTTAQLKKYKEVGVEPPHYMEFMSFHQEYISKKLNQDVTGYEKPNSFYVILDAKSLDYQQLLSPIAAKYSQASVEVLENIYMNRTKKIFLIRYPRFLTVVWSVLNVLLPKSLTSKIVVVKNKGDLEKYIDLSIIPEELGIGGSAEYTAREAPTQIEYQQFVDSLPEGHCLFADYLDPTLKAQNKESYDDDISLSMNDSSIDTQAASINITSFAVSPSSSSNSLSWTSFTAETKIQSLEEKQEEHKEITTPTTSKSNPMPISLSSSVASLTGIQPQDSNTIERENRQANDSEINTATQPNGKNNPALHYDYDCSASLFDKDKTEWERCNEEDALDSSISSSSSSTISFSTKRTPSFTSFGFFSGRNKDKLSERE